MSFVHGFLEANRRKTCAYLRVVCKRATARWTATCGLECELKRKGKTLAKPLEREFKSCVQTVEARSRKTYKLECETQR